MNNLEHFNANAFSNTDSAQTSTTQVIGHFINGKVVSKTSKRQPERLHLLFADLRFQQIYSPHL